MSSLISCPHCAQRIHQSAPSCPQCGAIQNVSNNTSALYSSYDQVPWYRKLWFAVASVILFMPLFLVIAFTGDIYHQKDGKLQTIPKRVKFTVLVIFIILVVIRMNG